MSKSDRVNRYHSPWHSAPCCCSIVRPSLRFIMITFFLATTAPVSITHAFHKSFQTVLSSHRRLLFHYSNNMPNAATRQYSITRMFSLTTNNNTSSSTSLSTTNKLPRTPNTGGLRKLPVVKRSTELISKAKRAGWQIKPDVNMKNARNRARKHGAERLDAITKALCVPLRDAIRGYQNELRRLHPFERVVADLTVRARERKDGLTLLDVLVGRVM